MKDLRLEERFTIETEAQGVHLFDVYLEFNGVVYYIEGTSTVGASSHYQYAGDHGTIKEHESNYQIDIDDVYSGLDCEVQHKEESLLGVLKTALYAKI